MSEANLRIVRTSLNLNGQCVLYARRQKDWFEVQFKPYPRCTMYAKSRTLIKGYAAASAELDRIADITEGYSVRHS